MQYNIGMKVDKGHKMTKRKETKEEFEKRVIAGVREAMRKSYDNVMAGRRALEAARKEAKRLAKIAKMEECK